MTEPESTESDEILKTDALGRLRVRPEHREKMLDAFEASGMSGQAFAIHHGLKVQTFASWIQKRRRKRGDYHDEAVRRKLRMPVKSEARTARTKPSQGQSLNLVEVCVNHGTLDSDTPPIEVILSAGTLVRISSESQIGLLKTLILELSC